MPPDLARLRAALSALIAEPTEVRRILSVGCGDFPSAGVLRELFPSALLIGLERESTVMSNRAGVDRVIAEAARPPFKSRPGLQSSADFDLILVRHPDVDRHPGGWGQASRCLPGYLSPRGRILLSCFTATELQAIQAALLEGGAKRLPIRLGTAAVDLVGRDRWLAGFEGPGEGV